MSSSGRWPSRYCAVAGSRCWRFRGGSSQPVSVPELREAHAVSTGGRVRYSDRNQGQPQGQRPATGTAPVLRERVGKDRSRGIDSAHSIEQPPGHGANLVENRQRLLGLGSIDGSSLSEKPHVAVDFLGRGISNPPMVETISAGSAIAFSEVGWNRAHRLSPSPFERPGGDHDGLADPDHCS